MLKEQFNPHDLKYKKVEDLPKEEQKDFKNIEGGFVKKEAAKEFSDAESQYRLKDESTRDVLHRRADWKNKTKIIANLKKLDFSKKENQEKFQKEYEKLDLDKYRVIRNAHNEALNEKLKKQITESLNDPEVQKLAEQIESNQESITKEILPKTQDIYKPHFATHGIAMTRLMNPTLLTDGIFSKNYNSKYKKDVKERRPLVSDFMGYSGESDQGEDRVSTFSVAHIINTIEKIALDEPINKDIDKEETIKDIIVIVQEELRHLAPSTQYSISPEEAEEYRKKYPLLLSLLSECEKVIEEESIKNNNQEVLMDNIPNSTWNKLFKIITNNLQDFEKQLMEYLYKEKNNYGYNRILIDINKISDDDINKDLLRHKSEIEKYRNFISASRWQHYELKMGKDQKLKDRERVSALRWRRSKFGPEQFGFTHPWELPIEKRVKTNCIAGVLVDKVKNNMIEPCDILINLQKFVKNSINLEAAKRHLSEEDLKIIEKIQKDDEKIETKDLLMLASKFCNYNLFREDLSEKDYYFALANYVKMPVYSGEGDLLWPKKMNHEEVQSFIKERKDKQE